MSNYKKVPKQLRKHFRKQLRSVVWGTIKAAIVFPWLYAKRKEYFHMGRPELWIGKLKDSDWYWLADCTEHVDGDPKKPLDFVSCWWGDEPFRKRKGYNHEKAGKIKRYLWAFNWVVIRNGFWNGKMRNGYQLSQHNPEIVYRIVNTGEANITTWRNQKYTGEQCVVLRFGNLQTFRYSRTVPLHKLNPLRLLGYRWKNVMRGAGNARWIYKNRIWKNLIQ